MFIILPILWIVLWFAIGGVLGAFSGLAPKNGGLTLFLAVFLGGGFGLPIIGGIVWWIRSRLKRYH